MLLNIAAWNYYIPNAMDNGKPSSYMVQKLADLSECPICTGILTKPKMLLPCTHSFCLSCLEHYAKDKQPSDQITCPLCRGPINLPSSGFKSLPTNYLMENIVELHRISQPERRHAVCDNCTGRRSTGWAGSDEIKVNTYCVECRQKLCGRCVEAHRKLKIMATHQVVKLGTQESLTRVEETMRRRVLNCEEHSDKPASGYCSTCRRTVCSTCVSGSQHKDHSTGDIPTAARRMRREIRKDTNVIKKSVADLQRRVKSLVQERDCFDGEARKLEEEIRRRTAQAVAKIESQRDRLLEETDAVRRERLKEMEGVQQEIEMTICMLECLRAFGLEVVGRGNDTDAIRLAKGIRTQAHELFRVQQMPIQPVNLCLTDAPDFPTGWMGDISVLPKKIDYLSAYLATPELVTTISGEQSVSDLTVSGLTVLDYKLYIIRLKSLDLYIYNTEPVTKPYRRVSIMGQELQDLVSCSANRCLYVCDWGTCYISRLQPNGTVISMWKLKDKPGGLSVTSGGNVIVSCPNSRQILEFTSEGSQVRSLQLSKELDKPWHALQLLATNRLAVCCWHRIGLLDDTGSTGHQFHGGNQGSQLAQVYCPSHLAVDANDVIIVADTNNNRIKLLGPSMEYRELITAAHGLKKPRRLYLDKVTRLLYIGLNDGGVVVYHITL